MRALTVVFLPIMCHLDFHDHDKVLVIGNLIGGVAKWAPGLGRLSHSHSACYHSGPVVKGNIAEAMGGRMARSSRGGQSRRETQ